MPAHLPTFASAVLPSRVTPATSPLKGKSARVCVWGRISSPREAGVKSEEGPVPYLTRHDSGTIANVVLFQVVSPDPRRHYEHNLHRDTSKW